MSRSSANNVPPCGHGEKVVDLTSPSRIARRANENDSVGLDNRVDVKRHGVVLIRSKDKAIGNKSLDKIGISLCNRERIRKNRRLLLFCGNIIIGFFFLCVVTVGPGRNDRRPGDKGLLTKSLVYRLDESYD